MRMRLTLSRVRQTVLTVLFIDIRLLDMMIEKEMNDYF